MSNMTEPGGPSTQEGVFYQNSVSAFWIVKLLELTEIPHRDQVLDVRVEAPESVDDIVIRFADGHRNFCSAKLSVKQGTKPWKKLWQDFLKQSKELKTATDRLSLVVGRETTASKHVLELCSIASTAEDQSEAKRRFNKAQTPVFKGISSIVGGEYDTLQILKLLDVSVFPIEQLERDFANTASELTEHSALHLLSLLRDLSGGDARKRGLFRCADLRRRLRHDHGIQIREPTEWGLGNYRAYLTRRATIEIPGTTISRPADDLFVWPRTQPFGRDAPTSFENEHLIDIEEDQTRLIDLSEFPYSGQQRVVLVAGPGQGKSALLTTLSGKLAGTELVPVKVSLAAFSEADCSLLSFVENQLGKELNLHADWRALSERGLLVLLLDGLDEVPSIARARVLDKVQAYSALYAQVPWLLSVRDPSAVVGLPDAETIELLPFNDDDIVRYVDKAREYTGSEDGWNVLRRLQLYPDLERLARIPLFLAMLLSVTDLSEHKAITRSDLIEAYLKTVFSPAAHKPDFATKDVSAILRSVAEKLAFDRLEQQSIGVLELQVRKVLEEVATDTDEATFLFDRLQINGVLKRQSSVRLSFPYPIVQEYLAACFLVAEHPKSIGTRIDDAVQRPWAQVLQFALELHDCPEPILKEMANADQDAFCSGLRLVGRCIANGASVSSEFRDLVGDRLADYWSGSPFRSRDQVGRLVLDGFAENPTPKLKRTLHKAWLIQGGAGDIISKINDKALTLSVTASLLESDRSSFMYYRSLQPALNSVGDAVLELIVSKLEMPEVTGERAEQLASMIGNLSATGVSRDFALTVARNTSLPLPARSLAYGAAGAPLPNDGALLCMETYRSEDWDNNYFVRDLVSLNEDPETFIQELIDDPSVPIERRRSVVARLQHDLPTSAQRRALAERNIARDDIDPELRTTFQLFEIRHGNRSIYESMMKRATELDVHTLGTLLSLSGHSPNRILGDQAAKEVQARSLSADDLVSLASSVNIGMLYIFEMDMLDVGALRFTLPHPSIEQWRAIIEEWSARNDLMPIQTIQLLAHASEMGSEWAANELATRIKSIENFDAHEWLEADEDGHSIGRALRLIRQREPTMETELLERVVASERYNIKQDGILALEARSDENALTMLIQLHGNEVEWFTRSRIASAVELVSSRLGIIVMKNPGSGRYSIGVPDSI